VERLFEGILQNDLDSAEIRYVCDYRQYFQYDIGFATRIRRTRTESRWKPSSRRYCGKSREGKPRPLLRGHRCELLPFYKDDESAIRLVLFEEAFSKMDDERIGSIIDFFKRLGMQIVTAVPTEKTNQ
jgi:uncharacterized protein YPO0396